MKAIKDMTRAEIDKLANTIRRRIRAEHNRKVKDPGFAARERAYLKAHPHLAEHKHCGYADVDSDRARRRVVCPNGVVLYSTWYKVPTTDADSRKAMKEAKWLNSVGGVEASWAAA